MSPADPKSDLGRLRPWLPEFARAAEARGEDLALLCAICLRETWAGWAPGYVPRGSAEGRGDRGHGHGLMQIDDRGPYRKHLPQPGQPWPAFSQALTACTVLADARRELAAFSKHPLFPVAVVAAYNAGSPAVARALRKGRSPDAATAGGDYATWVLRKRAELLERHPEEFRPLAPALVPVPQLVKPGGEP